MHSVPPLDLRPDHLEIVRGILGKHVPAHDVWAFGSRVGKTAKATSDLDLVIVGDTPIDLVIISALKDAFSESSLPMKVDILDWATVAEPFRRRIDERKAVIQQK